MKFALPHLENEFEHLCEETREALTDLDKWSLANGLPEVVVTHINRSEKQNDEIYGGLKKFTWHFVWCAADIRNRHYSIEQLAKVMERLKMGRDSSMYEILDHDVGRGGHIHFARRDFEARRKFEQSRKPTVPATPPMKGTS